jgi:Mor family transcriptional regulator
MPVDWLAEIAAEITLENLPQEYQIVAETCGLENAIRLSQRMSSLRIYVPSFEKLIRERRDARIRAEFTGFNHRELALRYGLSETWIRMIVQRKPAYEQADMFAEAGGGR